MSYLNWVHCDWNQSKSQMSKSVTGSKWSNTNCNMIKIGLIELLLHFYDCKFSIRKVAILSVILYHFSKVKNFETFLCIYNRLWRMCCEVEEFHEISLFNFSFSDITWFTINASFIMSNNRNHYFFGNCMCYLHTEFDSRTYLKRI